MLMHRLITGVVNRFLFPLGESNHNICFLNDEKNIIIEFVFGLLSLILENLYNRESLLWHQC